MQPSDPQPQIFLSERDKAMMTIPEMGSKEIALTPEQIGVIDKKREVLANEDSFAFRFVNSKEYFDTLESDTTPRQLETVTEEIRKMLGFQLWAQRDRIKPSTSLWAWDENADRQTAWHTSARAIFFWQNALSQYKKIWENAKREQKTISQARTEFAELLKENASEYVQKISENKFTSAGESLSKPMKSLRDEHRVKLQELLAKDSQEISREDLKFLMRFYKGQGYFFHRENAPDSQSGESYMPYELLEIWPAVQSKPEINPWNDEMGFTAIPKGTNISEMLGVALLSPHDKDFTAEIAARMAEHSKINPGNAHLIINPNFYELFPNEGNDVLPRSPKSNETEE